MATGATSEPRWSPVKVLLVGAGAIGTVYGVQLAESGHSVDVLAHGRRTERVASTGLCTTDTATGGRDDVHVPVVLAASVRPYDLVLVSVRAEQVLAACDDLRMLIDSPAVLFFGNSFAGHRGLPEGLPGSVSMGFPGVGGALVGDRVEYSRGRRQATTLEAAGAGSIGKFKEALARSHFPTTGTTDIDGWLAFHSVLVSSAASAMARSCGSAIGLSADRTLLTLMCRSIEEGFRSLHGQGVRGLPRHLLALHQPAWRRTAVRYWARALRSPTGAQCLVSRSETAEHEMSALAGDVIRRVDGAGRTDHLHQLLAPYAALSLN